MSAFDVAICVNAAVLNRVSASLYGKPGLRRSLFAGSAQTQIAGVAVTVAYDVQAAPTVVLDPPSAGQWAKAIRADGQAAAPAANALVAHFPAVLVTKEPGTPNAAQATVSFDAIATVALAGGVVRITPLAVSIDLSAASAVDQVLYKALIIPRVLAMVGEMLGPQTAPAINFAGVRFGDAALSVGAGRLAAVANLAGRPTPAAPDPSTLPDGPFAVLLSRDAMTQVAAAGTAALRGKQLSKSGSAGFGIGDASYTATLAVTDLSVAVTSPVTVDARVGLQASASASVDVLGAVWDQIQSGLETAGKAIADAFSSY